MSRFAIWNLVAESDGQGLEQVLAEQGYALRVIKTATACDDGSFWAAAAEGLGFDTPSNWSGFIDLARQAVLPDDDEGDKSALLWYGAGAVASCCLGTFLMAFDLLVDQGRQLYAQGSEVLLFALGDGENFPGLA